MTLRMQYIDNSEGHLRYVDYLCVVAMSLKWLELIPVIDAGLAQSVEHETLNLRVVGSSPTLGVNFCDSVFYKNCYV